MAEGGLRRWVRRIFLYGVLPLSLLLVAAVGGALLMRQQMQPIFSVGWKIPAGINERLMLRLNGLDQFVSVRGQDRNAPLLVYLHGGPGGALSDVTPHLQKPWEDFFVVVNWDQRGAGRSIDNPTDPMTVQIVRDDAIKLIEKVTKRFGQRKVVLVGSSWGSLLGHEVVKARPDLIHSFVAIGVVVDWRQNFAETARLVEDHARRTGNQPLLERASSYGPPPAGGPEFLAYIERVQKDMATLGKSWFGLTNIDIGRYFTAAMLLSPYPTLGDLAGSIRRAGDPSPAERMGPSLAAWNLERSTGMAFDAPIVWVQGDHDWQTPTTLAAPAFPKLCAPWKVYVPLHNSAHYVLTEEPGRVLKVLLDYALPASRGEVPAGVMSAPCPPAAPAG